MPKYDSHLGFDTSKLYTYTGIFAPQYLWNRTVKIQSFHKGGNENKSCVAFIVPFPEIGGQCSWIPLDELLNNLILLD